MQLCSCVMCSANPCPLLSHLQVYADRFLRLWDINSGNCVLEVFTGHKLGETVMALAVDTADQRIATADSAGFIKVSASVPSWQPLACICLFLGNGQGHDLYTFFVNWHRFGI